VLFFQQELITILGDIIKEILIFEDKIMYPFYNPAFIVRIAQSYLSDINRIWNLDATQFKRYQDKAFRKIVRYSFNIPLYYNKYKKSNISHNDIKGLEDIIKLPIITKEDIRSNFPDKIIPKNFDKKNSYLISSSGSTGKPLFIYCSIFSAVKRLEAFARILKAYGGNWRKSKSLLIIDLTPGSIEYATYVGGGLSFFNKLFSLNNIKYLPIKEKAEILIEKINKFQPEFLGSDPNMLGKLANLKLNGLGSNINPKYIFSSGSMLDQYTRRYIENAFDSKVLDVYASTEAGPMAFECIRDSFYHINSDFVHLEFLDESSIPVSYNESGNVIITRLYGRDTPIIRYNGLEDIAIPIDNTCSCGIHGEMIKKIEGRTTDLILLSNGESISPLTITGIPAKIMEEYNTFKIKQFQIVQNKKSELEIYIVIDEKQRKVGISIDTIIKEFIKRINEQINSKLEIIVKEKEFFEYNSSSDKFKVFVSNLKK
jgi:phenylacetate-CoA ligase